MPMTDVPFATLVGETLTDIRGLDLGGDEVTFTTASGRVFRMYHSQDCCESVSLVDIAGEVTDLIGSPILKADESSNSDTDEEYNKRVEYPPSDSWTWTFYHLATVKGYVTLRWLGESNGYYSESVDFVEDR